MNPTIPNYCNTQALQFAVRRITDKITGYNKKTGKATDSHTEYPVGSWVFTIMGHVFSGPEWLNIPEYRDPNSGRRPDLVVKKSRLDSKGQMGSAIYLIMELKSSSGE